MENINNSHIFSEKLKHYLTEDSDLDDCNLSEEIKEVISFLLSHKDYQIAFITLVLRLMKDIPQFSSMVILHTIGIK